MKLETLSPRHQYVLENLPHKRKKAGKALVEGQTTVESALLGNWPISSLIYDPDKFPDSQIQKLIFNSNNQFLQLFQANGSVWKKLTSCESAPGIGVLLNPPELPNLADGSLRSSTILLDQAADPGNVGTIIRSARAFGFQVAMTPGSVDLCNEKLLRATSGMIFEKDFLLAAPPLDKLFTSKPFRESAQIIAFDPKATKLLSDFDTKATHPGVFVFGREDRGLTHDLFPTNTVFLRIPMEPGVESLNLAMSATVAMYEIYRRKR